MKIPRAAIATVIGGFLSGAIPWCFMYFVKSGEIGASTAVEFGVFAGLVAGALLQWWASHK